MRATKAAALARPAQERVSLELLGIDADAQKVYIVASDRVLPVLVAAKRRWFWTRRRRTDNAVRGLTDVGEEIVELWNAGASESELRPFEYFIRNLIDSCSTGRCVRSVHELDREEQTLECEETALQTARLTSELAGKPVPVAQLVREADLGEREAHVQLEKSRALRRDARKRGVRTIEFPMDRAAARGAVQS